MTPVDSSVISEARSIPISPQVSRLVRIFGPLILAGFLLVLNHAGTLAGVLYPPPGYVSNLLPRTTDHSQYLTWLHAFQNAPLIPDYHAPWLTEPALFNPALWLVAQVAWGLSIDARAAYLLFQCLLYLFAAYSLFFAIRAFTDTAAQAGAAFIAAVLAVPVPSLLALPCLAASAGLKSALPTLPGIGDFVWMSSDGFFHGIYGSALVTLGTATMLLAFGLLAHYFRTLHRKFLVSAVAVTCVSAFLHPFEVCVIASAGSLALLLRDPRNLRRGLAEAFSLGMAGLVGILPYVVVTLRHPWLRAVGKLPSWVAYAPPRLLVMLGLPMIVALALSLFKPRRPAGTDLLLLFWVVCTLIGLYVPGLPDVQHFLDGILYAGALLLVRQAVRLHLYQRIRASFPRASAAAFAVLCLCSIAPYFIYSHQSFIDGHSTAPVRLASTLISVDEASTVSWFETHAKPEDLVLAPVASASLFATPPMHSFASHQTFGLTYDEQVRFCDAFFAGRLGRDVVHDTLAGYGVRYVVIPTGSAATAYVQTAVPRARIGSFAIFEFPDHRMQTYAARTTPVFR
jgi:hypothetical protein